MKNGIRCIRTVCYSINEQLFMPFYSALSITKTLSLHIFVCKRLEKAINFRIVAKHDPHEHSVPN